MKQKMKIPGLKDHIRGVMLKMMKMSKGEKGKTVRGTGKNSLKKDILGQQDKTGMLFHTKRGI